MNAQLKETQSGCAESEPSTSWREYMAQNPDWQTERTPNVYAAGYHAGMKHPRPTPVAGPLKEALSAWNGIRAYLAEREEMDAEFTDADEAADAREQVALVTAALEAMQSPPVYPELVNGQNVKQPTPFVLVEIAPSGFAEGLTYGPLRYDGSRLIKYVLAAPTPEVSELSK